MILFSRVNASDDRRISVEIDGRIVSCCEGDTVAAVVILYAEQPYRRSILSGAARAPFCMMGICFECLIEIDGVPNQQGCLRNVEPGMVIRRQLGKLASLEDRTSNA
jgi:predicted molibdopterin-dependent oxidoreductase YjgC